MKKIVILCNYFAPDNKIAAIRITKLAKYFRQHGYDVTVFSEQKHEPVKDELLEKDAEGICSIRICNSGFMERIGRVYQKLTASVRKKQFDNMDNRMRLNRKSGKYEFFPFQTACPVLGSLDYCMELLRQYDLFWESKRRLEAINGLDCIFSSYGDYFGVLAGRYLHKKHSGTKWMVDFRDGIYQYKFTPKYVKWIARLYERYIWREADCITAVSKGLCRTIPRKYWKKVHCVTNGFDREERKGIHINNGVHDKLRFAYTGGMYGGMRNLSPVFQSIRLLVDQKEIDSSRIEFCYAGKETAFQILVSQARAYGLDANCIYCGNLPRREVLKLQMESDILLVVAVNSATEKGNLPGKALEYMAADRPVIAVINGDKPDSELGEVVTGTKLGFAYEEAGNGESRQELCQYILKKYHEFLEHGRLAHNPDEKALGKFDYQYLGNKMVRIMESLDADHGMAD